MPTTTSPSVVTFSATPTTAYPFRSWYSAKLVRVTMPCGYCQDVPARTSKRAAAAYVARQKARGAASADWAGHK